MYLAIIRIITFVIRPCRRTFWGRFSDNKDNWPCEGVAGNNNCPKSYNSWRYSDMKVVIWEKTWGGGSRNESYAANCSDVVGRRAARQSKVETDTFPIKKDRNKNIHFSSKYRSRKSPTLDSPLWFTIGNSPKFPPQKSMGHRLLRAISQSWGNIFAWVLFLYLRLDLYFHFCCLLCLSDVWAISNLKLRFFAKKQQPNPGIS